jgi:hypothetical protein
MARERQRLVERHRIQATAHGVRHERITLKETNAHTPFTQLSIDRFFPPAFPVPWRPIGNPAISGHDNSRLQS